MWTIKKRGKVASIFICFLLLIVSNPVKGHAQEDYLDTSLVLEKKLIRNIVSSIEKEEEKKHAIYITPFSTISLIDRTIFSTFMHLSYEYKFHSNFSFRLGGSYRYPIVLYIHKEVSFIKPFIDGFPIQYEISFVGKTEFEIQYGYYRYRNEHEMFVPGRVIVSFKPGLRAGIRISPKHSFLVIKIGSYIEARLFNRIVIDGGIYWNFGIKF